MKVCFEVKKQKRAWAWERMKVAFEVKKNGMGESQESSLCVLGVVESVCDILESNGKTKIVGLVVGI